MRELQAITLESSSGSLAAALPAGAALADNQNEDDLDRAFERLESGAPPSGVTGTLAEDPVAKLENTELFREMAVVHARPVREFMLELALGPTTKQWLEIVKPALANLLKGAKALDQRSLTNLLASFDGALSVASRAFGHKIAGSERDALLAEYSRLARELPLAFDLKNERELREPLLVHHLLQQVPGVHKLTIDKLYAAGLGSLDALCRSSVADLVALGRLDAERADAILRRFRSYWRERTERPIEHAHEQVKQRLRALLERLGRAHAEFQRAEAAEDRARKRSARNERRSVSLEMNVLLAQLGEIELVEDLERSPTERRIERVRSYIEQPHRGPRSGLEQRA